MYTWSGLVLVSTTGAFSAPPGQTRNLWRVSEKKIQPASKLQPAARCRAERGRGCRPGSQTWPELGLANLVLFFCPRRDVSKLTPVFHHCTLPCGLSGEIVIEVTVASRLSVIVTTGLSHYTDTKDVGAWASSVLLFYCDVCSTFVNPVPLLCRGLNGVTPLLCWAVPFDLASIGRKQQLCLLWLSLSRSLYLHSSQTQQQTTPVVTVWWVQKDNITRIR